MSPPCVLPCFCVGVVLGWGGMLAVVFVRKLYLSAYAFYRLELPVSIACHAFLLSFVCPLLVRPALAKAANQQKPKNPSLHLTSLDFACLFLVLKAVFSWDPCIEGMSTNILKGPQINPTNPIFQILGKDPRNVCLFIANSAEGVVVFKLSGGFKIFFISTPT